MRTFAFAPAHPVLRALFTVLGMGTAQQLVELGPEVLRVRLGLGFRTEIPRERIIAAGRTNGRILAWGAHGFRGDWLINTASTGIVLIELDPVARARVLGFPIRLRRLRISLADPESFLAALGAPLSSR